MANEITMTASLQYSNPAQNIPTKTLSVSGVLASVTGRNFAEESQVIPTTAGGTALNVAGLSGLGWAMFKNDDPTNYVQILNAVSGTPMLQIPPGLTVGPIFFPSTITAPAALAHTASVLLEYLIVEP